MEAQVTPFEPVFSQLLEMNPWAVDLWERRSKLVSQQRWNMRARNQAGNKLTASWLSDFQVERRKVCRSRLLGSKASWDSWSSDTETLLSQYGSESDAAKYDAGSSENSEAMPPYNLECFWADIHLLTDVDVSGEVFTEGLDLSKHKFPASLLASSIQVERKLVVEAASIGSHSTFAMSKINGPCSFRDTVFGPWCNFVGTQFNGVSDFENTRFGFEGSFTATSFQRPVSFKHAVFEGSAPFCGAHFLEKVDFSHAQFFGTTVFDRAMFDDVASFEGTWFPDKVYVHGLPSKIVEEIVRADHSKSRTFQRRRFGLKDADQLDVATCRRGRRNRAASSNTVTPR